MSGRRATSWAEALRRLLVLGCTGWALGCGGATPEPPVGAGAESAAAVTAEAPRRPHVLLISIDTLRADHLGSYGHDRPTSPHLDQLAAEGVRYERAMAPTPWTLPSHGAMLTGVDPYLLGLTAQWRYLPPQVPTLAERLQATGYRTAAFVDSRPRGFVGGRRGFARGFERFDHAPHGDVDVPRYDMARTVDAALAWLDGEAPEETPEETPGETPGEMSKELSKEPWFLFLHTRSVHAIPNDEPCRDARCSPYFAPPPFGQRFVPETLSPQIWDNGEGRRGQDYLWWINERIEEGASAEEVLTPQRLDELMALYDGGIAYTDHHLGRLMAGLESRGLRDDTLVIVTSDHGEAFFEHRLLMHQEVYDSSLRVPLVLRWPAAFDLPPGQVIERPVTLEDIAPTVLAWASPSPFSAAAGADRGPSSGEPSAGAPSSGAPSSGAPSAGESPTEQASGDIAMTGQVLPWRQSADGGPRALFAYYLFPEKFSYRAFAFEWAGQRLVAHNPASDTLALELWQDLEGQGWRQQPTAPDDASVEVLRQRLRQAVRRQPVAEVDDPRHREPSRPGEVLSTLGYID